jgi:hypothetical protein
MSVPRTGLVSYAAPASSNDARRPQPFVAPNTGSLATESRGGAQLVAIGRSSTLLTMPAGVRGSVAGRWASFVITTITADYDPKTIGSWARSIGVSRSVLCECCRLVHVLPHNARDFARLLRAISRSGPSWRPEVLLDLADARTLRKLLARGGFSGNEDVTPTREEFMTRQQWIPQGNAGLMVLRVWSSQAQGSGDPHE